MAKVKGIAATKFQGRVGSLVFRNRGGENIVSERPANVKNPRSEAQQYQRMNFNSVIQAYSNLKEIVDHSWEGVTYGAKSQALFTKLNLNRLQLSSQLSGAIARTNTAVVPYNFQISKGSLLPLDYGFREVDASGDSVTHKSIILQWNVGSTNPATLTLAQFLASNGLQRGDQLTFVAIVPKEASTFDNSGAIYQISRSEMVVARCIISLTAEDSALPFADGNFNTEVFVEGQNLGVFDIAFSGGYMEVEYNIDSSYLMGIVASRKSNDSWLRSTQYLVGNSAYNDMDGESFTYRKTAVVQTYDPTSPYYLNNAE